MAEQFQIARKIGLTVKKFEHIFSLRTGFIFSHYMTKKIDSNDSSIGIFFALYFYTYPALKPFLNERRVRESDYFSIDNILTPQMKRFKAAACLMMGVVNFGKVTTTSWHTYTYLEL